MDQNTDLVDLLLSFEFSNYFCLIGIPTFVCIELCEEFVSNERVWTATETYLYVYLLINPEIPGSL